MRVFVLFCGVGFVSFVFTLMRLLAFVTPHVSTWIMHVICSREKQKILKTYSPLFNTDLQEN